MCIAVIRGNKKLKTAFKCSSTKVHCYLNPSLLQTCRRTGESQESDQHDSPPSQVVVGVLETSAYPRISAPLISSYRYLPTIISSASEALRRILVQISRVKRVELELNTDVIEDMRAASITANMRPRAPTG